MLSCMCCPLVQSLNRHLNLASSSSMLSAIAFAATLAPVCVYFMQIHVLMLYQQLSCVCFATLSYMHILAVAQSSLVLLYFCI